MLYVFTALAPEPIPPNEGLAWPLRIVAPEGSIVHARFPAAVAGGNVETSQRIVDVVLRALATALPARIPAASAGTMNNLAFGGMLGGRAYSYYETIAGGAGAGPGGPGASAVHTHMTNTMTTPVEALEELEERRVRIMASFEEQAGRLVETVVKRLNLVTESEVRELRRRVAHLERRVDQIGGKAA